VDRSHATPRPYRDGADSLAAGAIELMSQCTRCHARGREIDSVRTISRTSLSEAGRRRRFEAICAIQRKGYGSGGSCGDKKSNLRTVLLYKARWRRHGPWTGDSCGYRQETPWACDIESRESLR